MLTGWEKEVARLALEHLPLTIVLILAVIVLSVVVAVVYNRKISQTKDDREMQRLIIKQQGKIIRLLGAAPCISKRNATWLGDPKQNDQIPDQPECSYSNAVEKGDI